MPLNQRQQAAAHAPSDRPLKIIAGAGAGKTETLAARYVELVRQGTAPERIVLLTFTEDAAAEMRARVILRLSESDVALPTHALLQPWITTFHSFAMRLLREHGFEAGLPPAPRLLDDDEQADLLQAIQAAVEAEPQLANGYVPLDHTTYRWDTDEAWNKALGVFAALRRGGGSPAELEPHPQLQQQQVSTFSAHRAQLVPLVEYCFHRYTEHLHRRGVLDYDELLQAALRLLREQPAVGQRFDVVMVDEFQDTNRPQLELLQALQPMLRRTTVVGDPRQAIYGWNSARAESIYQFPFQETMEETGGTHALTENYRSHPAIVRVANLALHPSELAALAELEPIPERAERRLAALGDEPVVSLHLLADVAAEAQLVAGEITRLHRRGVTYNEIAVLLRARTALTPLLDALRAADVPYTLKGGSGFYLHWLVRLTSSLLRLIADPHAPWGDPAAWAHILESPLLGLPATLINRRGMSNTGGRPCRFHEWLDDPEAVPADVPDRDEIVARLAGFHDFFETARARWGLLAPGDYLQWLWQTSGLLGLALADPDPQTRLVLQQLLRDADDYAAAHPLEGIAGFAGLLARQVQTQPRVALPTARSSNAVEIATVHQAKGREWPVVFVYNSALPGKRAGQVERVLWDEQWKLVISAEAPSKAKGGDALQQLRDDFRRRKRNEERSIWYVALTRAQERLYLLHSGCALDSGHFADARDKLQRYASGEAIAKDDEGVHFFHELWQHLDGQQPDPEIVRLVAWPDQAAD